MERDYNNKISYFGTLENDSRNIPISSDIHHSDIHNSDLRNVNMLSYTNMDIEANFEINTDMNSDKNNINYDNYVDESDNIDEEEFNLEINGVNRVLHKSKSKNIDEIVLNLLELYVRHKWTKISLRDILTMLQKILPKDNQLPNSVHKLFQYVRKYTSSFHVMKHYYCKDCLYYNGFESKIDKCLSCNTDKNFSFFFEIDISEQIKFMFENLKLYAKLNSSSFDSDKNIITHIIDGSEYTG